MLEQALEGKKPRRAPTRRPRPGQGQGSSSERTPGGSKASKRACRPFTGEPGVVRTDGQTGRAHGRAHEAGLAVTGQPSSRLMRLGSPPGEPPGKELARRGKWPSTFVPHRAGGGRMRTRREATAHESGHGSPGREGSAGQLPRDASGMKEGREASGRHGVTASSARARAVPRAQLEPSRGARTLRTAPTKGVAFLRPLRAAQRPRGERRGTRRSGVRREQEPQERRTRGLRNGAARASGPGRLRGQP